MTKIHPEFEKKEYTVQLHISNDEFDEITKNINELKDHPNILNPRMICRDEANIPVLHYSVFANGSTLRNWINTLNQPTRKSIRTSFRLKPRMNHLDIMLQLIDACEFMLSTHMLTGQTCINPDFIWVEYDETNKFHVKLINTVDTTTTNICDYIHHDKNYWAPEILSKYSNIMFYSDMKNDDVHPILQTHITKHKSQKVFKRYDTRPSTISIVYSLGLILYFIATNKDPYDGHRTTPTDRPYMLEMNLTLSKLIWNATEPDVKVRPTLQDWKQQITTISKSYTNKSCILM